MPVKASKFYSIINRVKENKNADEVPEEEVISFLRRNGHKLNEEEVKYFLKEFFGVEIGDTIIKHLIPAFIKKVAYPSGSLIINEKIKMIAFKVYNIATDKNSNVSLFITESNDFGESYPGDDDGSGIFHFFIDRDFAVLKGYKDD